MERLAQLVIFVVVVNSGMKRGEEVKHGLQVVIPDSLKSIVSVKVVTADVICRVGGADPSERHRVQLGLNRKHSRMTGNVLEDRNR